MTFQGWLRRQEACRSARQWVGDKDPQHAWDTCVDKFWLVWLVTRLHHRRRGLVNPNKVRQIRRIAYTATGTDQIRALLPRLPPFFGDFLSQREASLLRRTLREHRKARRR